MPSFLTILHDTLVVVVHVSEWPRTTSGKINRKELQIPEKFWKHSINAHQRGDSDDVNVIVGSKSNDFEAVTAIATTLAIPMTKYISSDDDAIANNRNLMTHTEKVLAVMWQNVLGVNDVALDDDFFKLGGFIQLRRCVFLQKLKRKYH